MDIAVWRPVLGIALLVGVYLPLLEAGMEMVKDGKDAKTSGICVFSSLAVNPVFGWALTLFLDNNGLIGNKERSSKLNLSERLIIPGISLLICTFSMALAGMIPGIPPLLNLFI